jgi:hypothetical protein
MAIPKIPLKNDRYKKVRGGYSRLLDISCAHCGTHLCYYQKDGPGILKRMYIDRIHELTSGSLDTTSSEKTPHLICSKCKQHIGVPIVYQKENRLAYRLFIGAVSKKIAKKQ